MNVHSRHAIGLAWCKRPTESWGVMKRIDPVTKTGPEILPWIITLHHRHSSSAG
jgi:hypothetical protein